YVKRAKPRVAGVKQYPDSEYLPPAAFEKEPRQHRRRDPLRERLLGVEVSGAEVMLAARGGVGVTGEVEYGDVSIFAGLLAEPGDQLIPQPVSRRFFR